MECKPSAYDDWQDCFLFTEVIVAQPPLIMTTEPPDDEKLLSIQWDNKAAPGLSGCMFPGVLTPLDCQIAGHPFNGEKQTIGN